MIRKYHNHKPQTTPWHREEELLNHLETLGRQIKQSNQLSLPHQDDCNTRMDSNVRGVLKNTRTDAAIPSVFDLTARNLHIMMPKEFCIQSVNLLTLSLCMINLWLLW